MSEKTEEATTRKPSANKSIKKLRAISMVCSLTRSWQQWVSENEEKQSSEPSGWAPGYPEDPKDSKKEAAKNRLSQKSLPNQEDVEAPGQSRIRTTQMVKTVTRDVQERSAGIEFLTKRICNDPSTDELDKILSKKGTPTRRRKCSNMVSELTRGWKEMEKEKKQAKEGSKYNEFPEAEERALQLGTNQEDTANDRTKENTESSAVRIKRASVLGSKKDVEDANKINALSKKYSAVGNLKNCWQNWASKHSINQKLNPFSEDFDYEYSMSTRLQKGEEGYGRPKEGSKTAERARRAEAHIHREIDDMCYIIRTMADPDPDGYTRVTFGELFDRYVRISDKVVGILMRARKHRKVDFEREMLWQGQDDGVIITLLV
ncbi:actin-binding Rho-activating protein-like [Myxocyprinus asiaticus]|uniref:actin-binding Rho-activating protein-like n=1 Tax=Myxocyprinus asiaticus TaxID=70543 RepID=UPI002222D2A6|nr:actin-binding Rho-activating protein-like [Myxocyprinus asiaticus]XP_051519003.1 actin-binding Rho-activating protein-like [Myxocyprinus asiaticus]